MVCPFAAASGPAASAFEKEILLAKKNYPDLRFKYPSPQQLVYMKRDLVQVDPAEADEALTRLASEMEPEELEYLLKKKLRELPASKD